MEISSGRMRRMAAGTTERSELQYIGSFFFSGSGESLLPWLSFLLFDLADTFITNCCEGGREVQTFMHISRRIYETVHNFDAFITNSQSLRGSKSGTFIRVSRRVYGVVHIF